MEDIIETLKLMMNCKCYAMQLGSKAKCMYNGGCDGSCKLFKNAIKVIESKVK